MNNHLSELRNKYLIVIASIYYLWIGYFDDRLLILLLHAVFNAIEYLAIHHLHALGHRIIGYITV